VTGVKRGVRQARSGRPLAGRKRCYYPAVARPLRLDLAIDEVDFVVLDAETTGLRPEHDHVVALGAVRVRGGRVSATDRFDRLVRPEGPIPAAATHVHGITDGMVADAPPLDAVLRAFAAFAGDAVLVGHDLWFDLAFLRREADRRGAPPIHAARIVLDTRWLSRALHGPGPSHELDVVAARLGVGARGRHSALGDAVITANVLVRLLGLARAQGIATLGAVVRFAGGP